MGDSRRDFIKKVGKYGLAGAGLYLFGGFLNKTGAAPLPVPSDLVNRATLAVAEGTDYKRLMKKAFAEFGGLDNFIPEDGTVVVKPNIGWDRAPIYAANTNPDLVAAVISLCFAAGAGKVKVFDRTCDEQRRCYKNSGIAAAAEEAGAEVSYIDDMLFKNLSVKNGKAFKKIKVYSELSKADTVINIPIAKDHGIAGLTLGMKNLMGVIGGNRGKWHFNLSKKLVDLITVVKPELTVLDASRILLAGGPQGGDLDDVRKKDKIIVGTDYVAVDAYGTTLFGMDPLELGVVKEAAKRNIGATDLENIKVVEIT
ncbi:MAG: DUF362 domain-containing protein [bacterium]|nr:DUF362 domain-containing protein [bacterium]